MASIKGNPVRADVSEVPEVSVVVTTYQEASNIGALIRSLAGQRHLLEVVLVDALSTDGTAQIAAQEAEAHGVPLRVESRDCGRSEGRNLGAEMARGNLLAFTDGDCVASPIWLEELVAGYHPGRWVVGHTRVVGRNGFRLRRVPMYYHQTDVSFPSCNMLVAREDFLAVGGFDPGYHTAEDMDLNIRLASTGFELQVQEHAEIQAKARDTLPAFLRQAYQNGYGRHRLTRLHPDVQWSRGAFFPDALRPAGALRLAAAGIGFTHATVRAKLQPVGPSTSTSKHS